MGNVRGAQLPELCPPLWRGVRAVEIRCTRGERSFENGGGYVRDTVDFAQREHVSGRFGEREWGFADEYNGDWEATSDCIPGRGDEHGGESMGRRRVGGGGRVELVGDQTVVGERFFYYSEND